MADRRRTEAEGRGEDVEGDSEKFYRPKAPFLVMPCLTMKVHEREGERARAKRYGERAERRGEVVCLQPAIVVLCHMHDLAVAVVVWLAFYCGFCFCPRGRFDLTSFPPIEVRAMTFGKDETAELFQCNPILFRDFRPAAEIPKLPAAIETPDQRAHRLAVEKDKRDAKLTPEQRAKRAERAAKLAALSPEEQAKRERNNKAAREKRKAKKAAAECKDEEKKQDAVVGVKRKRGAEEADPQPRRKRRRVQDPRREAREEKKQQGDANLKVPPFRVLRLIAGQLQKNVSLCSL
jgi:hypothetical protein